MDVISIGAPLTQVLRDSRVVARYDSTLQLETRDGALWAITTRFNPSAMRVVVPSLPGWRDGMTVHVRDKKIFGVDCELAWGDATRFDPVPLTRALSTAQRASAAGTIAGALARHQLPDALGFWNELSEMWNSLGNVIARSASDEAISKTATKDERRMTDDCFGLSSSILRFLGRGPGLTPAGDDFLQALLVTLASGDTEDSAAFESLRNALMPHLSRTTRMSRAFLQEAMQGWAFGALKNVLDDLPLVTQDKINALLSIGSTSGPAYVFGVLMGLTWSENQSATATHRIAQKKFQCVSV